MSPHSGPRVSHFIIPPYGFRLLIFILLGIMPFSGISSAETDKETRPPELTASLDQDSVTVGSVILLTLGYRLPVGGRLPDNPEIKGLEDLTVLERMTGSDRIRIRLLIDKLGQWKSGPLVLTYLDKEGKKQTLETGPVSLAVLSSLGKKPAEARLRPIRGIIPLRALWLKYLPWGGGVLFILLALAGLLVWHRKRSALRNALELLDPPHVRARKEIEQLEAHGLFEKGQAKKFYFHFSEILRRYIGAIRRFPASEFTTEEIAHHMDTEQDRKLLPLLRQADLVKFADTVPTSTRKEEDLKTAISYIQETSPAHENGGTTGSSQGVSR